MCHLLAGSILANHFYAHGVIFNLQLETMMAHQQFQSCIDACNACADACDHCASACLAEENSQKMARCISLDLDCAAICRLAASYMARNSAAVDVICNACADLCNPMRRRV